MQAKNLQFRDISAAGLARNLGETDDPPAGGFQLTSQLRWD